MRFAELDTLWYSNSPVPTGLGIAIDSGELARRLQVRGVRLQSLGAARDRSVREAHFDQRLNNSVRHGGNIPALWARASGSPTRVIGLSWTDETQWLLAAPESGIRNVRDLKHRRFGLPMWADVQIDFARAQALRGLENALHSEGMEVTDVELVDYPYLGTYTDSPLRKAHGIHIGATGSRRNQELVGLLRQDIDAIFLKGAHAAQLSVEFGLRVIADLGGHPDPLVRANNGTPRTLTVDQPLLDQHPDVVADVLDAVLSAEHWAWNHPLETRHYLARELNTSEYWVDAAYGDQAHLRLCTSLDKRSIDALQDMARFLHRWQFIPGPLDVRQWIDAKPLTALLQSGADP